MKPLQAWMDAGATQKVCFVFLFAVAVVTVVRAVRLTLDPEGRPERAGRFVTSTLGLAHVSLWFTGAAGALGLMSAWQPSSI